jgi:hypothetical protein
VGHVLEDDDNSLYLGIFDDLAKTFGEACLGSFYHLALTKSVKESHSTLAHM